MRNDDDGTENVTAAVIVLCVGDSFGQGDKKEKKGTMQSAEKYEVFFT